MNRENLLVCTLFFLFLIEHRLKYQKGIFVDNAMNLIPIPHWTENQISDFFDSTIKEALSRGLTSIHDADSKLHHLAFFKKSVQPPSSHILCFLTFLGWRNGGSYLLATCFRPLLFLIIIPEPHLRHGKCAFRRILGRPDSTLDQLRQAPQAECTWCKALCRR